MNDSVTNRWVLIIAGLTILLAGCALVALGLGSTQLSTAQILEAVFHDRHSVTAGIVLGIRLPRVILAIAVGGALSVAGTLLQGLFRNPLVEPYTLGISGGASLGVCIAILTGLPALLDVTAYPLAGFAARYRHCPGVWTGASHGPAASQHHAAHRRDDQFCILVPGHAAHGRVGTG